MQGPTNSATSRKFSRFSRPSGSTWDSEGDAPVETGEVWNRPKYPGRPFLSLADRFLPRGRSNLTPATPFERRKPRCPDPLIRMVSAMAAVRLSTSGAGPFSDQQMRSGGDRARVCRACADQGPWVESQAGSFSRRSGWCRREGLAPIRARTDVWTHGAGIPGASSARSRPATERSDLRHHTCQLLRSARRSGNIFIGTPGRTANSSGRVPPSPPKACQTLIQGKRPRSA